MNSVYAWAFLAIIALGAIGGMFPLWKSARLSPDSIQRRVYWACSAAAVLLVFFGGLPDLRSSLFASIAVGITLVAIALYWTNHFKVRGRVYAASANNRRPDRPPALGKDE